MKKAVSVDEKNADNKISPIKTPICIKSILVITSHHPHHLIVH